VLSACLIVFGALLAPLAVVTAWGKATLLDTDRFVATYAPLARTPAVQTYVVDQTMVVIDENVDINQLTEDLVAGLKGVGTGPRLSQALDALQGPATRGLETLIRTGVQNFVQSDAFATTWQEALRVSHSQLVLTAQGDPNAILQAQQNGTIGIQIGPIIASVKEALMARGISIASRIPAVNRVIPIAQSDQLYLIQVGHQLVVTLGTWLPWVSVVLVVLLFWVMRFVTR